MKKVSYLFGSISIVLLAAMWFQHNDKQFVACLLGGLINAVLFMRLQRAVHGSIPMARETRTTKFLNSLK